MKSLKNTSIQKKSENNTLVFSLNEHNSEKHSKIPKLIEETISELNSKFLLLANTLNQLKYEITEKMTNIYDISIEENYSTLNSANFQKIANKSDNNFNPNSLRNILKQNLIKTSRNDSKQKRLNHNMRSNTFGDNKNNNLINNFCSPQMKRKQNNKNNKKKYYKPIKPQLIYNNNINYNNNNIEENKSKSNEKQQIPKNVSFNSKIIMNNGANEKQIKDQDNHKYKIRLNSDDKNYIEKNKKKKVLEILKTSPVLSIEEKMKSINNTYSNNLTLQENEKKTNIKTINKIIVNDNKNSSLDSNEFSDNNSNSDNENMKFTFPTRTSQIGINFLSKEKEEDLYNDKSNEAKKICELIYILLEEESQFEENNDVKSLFKFLFDTFKVDCIKDLFFKVIYQKVYVSKTIDNGISKIFQRLVLKHNKEFKLICKATNQPLSWLTMNILEIDKYFQLVYDK